MVLIVIFSPWVVGFEVSITTILVFIFILLRNELSHLEAGQAELEKTLYKILAKLNDR